MATRSPPKTHPPPPLAQPPAAIDEQWHSVAVADRSREQAQNPSCPTRRLLRGDGYSRRLSPTFPSEQVVNYYSATNGHDAVKGTSAVPPRGLNLYQGKAMGSECSEANGKVSSVIYPQTSSVVAATTDAS